MLTYVDVTLSLINLKLGLSNIFKVIYVVGTGTIMTITNTNVNEVFYKINEIQVY